MWLKIGRQLSFFGRFFFCFVFLLFLSEEELSSELEDTKTKEKLEDISSSLKFASPGLEVIQSEKSKLETLESGSSDDELAGILGPKSLGATSKAIYCAACSSISFFVFFPGSVGIPICIASNRCRIA